jgi:hypothetical protein
MKEFNISKMWDRYDEIRFKFVEYLCKKEIDFHINYSGEFYTTIHINDEVCEKSTRKVDKYWNKIVFE